MTEPWELSAFEALQAFREKTLAPTELWAALAQRIEKHDQKGSKPINAITEVIDVSMDEAKAADQHYQKQEFHEPLGSGPRALMGLPIVTKEKHFLSGHTFSEGLKARAHEVATRTHPLVQRIQNAGGTITARTTSPEFSCATVTHSPQWGITRNPWNLDYSPGGSSGGSGAALAAGYAPLATASDIAGSTRIPAANNGVVGYKAPYGRVPGSGPMASDWYRGDGPMARTVADTALLYNVIAGMHASDHNTIPGGPPVPLNLSEGANWFRGKRIGLSATLGGYEIDEHVAAALRKTRSLLEAAGARVIEVNPGWRSCDIRDISMAHFGHLLADSMSQILTAYDAAPADYTRQFLHDAKCAAQKTSLWQVLNAEHQMQRDLSSLLSEVEVLITPVSAASSLEADASYLNGITFDNASGQKVHLEHYWQAHMTLPFNINNRCPVLAVPAPQVRSPIPVGLQIVGRAYDETTVFKAGYAFEDLYPFPRLAPLCGGSLDEANQLCGESADAGRI